MEVANQDELSDGSCCILALIQSGKVTVANLGDSICTLVKKDRSWQKLSSDHSPARADEKDRVLKSHGTIIRGKVQGELAVTRAFGNRELKDIIISKPEIFQ